MLRDALSTTMDILVVHKLQQHHHITSSIIMAVQAPLVTALVSLATLHVFAVTFESHVIMNSYNST